MPTNGTYKVFHSPKKHVENVTTLIHQKKDTIDVEWEDVEVTPLYNYKDNFNYLLVDLYPQGFTILKVIRTSPFSVKAKMCIRDSLMSYLLTLFVKDTLLRDGIIRKNALLCGITRCLSQKVNR